MLASIESDARHRGIIVAMQVPISERAFPDWSMGFRRLAIEEAATVSGFSDYLRSGTLEPLGGDQSAMMHRLLETFQIGRAHV